MLISHLSEDNNDDGRLDDGSSEDENNSSLIQRDLVTLYENVETRQSTVTFKNTCRSSNQYVETIIYNDQESDDSDVSDVYSNEDLCDVILINKERIDFINSMPPLDKTVCHNSDGKAIQSDYNVKCNENLLLKYPFLKEQFSALNNFSNFTTFDGTIFSTPLLNFIFCNHLDGGSNLYMDNIIQYTKRTIDQLKRISNGDYLTEKVKEKWRTMGNNYDYGKDNKLAVVRTESNPICEDYNKSSLKNAWRNILHSALDIRYLRKILEQSIVVKIPRQIYYSLNVTGKDHDNDLVITCKEETKEDAEDLGVDIVLNINPTCTENIEYNINPLLILQSMYNRNKSLLPMEYSRYTSTTNIGINVQNKITITEINEYETDQNAQNLENDEDFSSKFTYKSDSTETANTISSGLCISEISSQFTFNNHDLMSNYPGQKQINNSEHVNIETQISCFTSPPDDLFCSIQKLNTQTVLLEENEEPLNKKKSLSKVRIKSPYENKSHVIEEMKRRKLLEIREKRERKKKIHSENCKVTKYKHGKGAIMAQSTNSVTKLSISNKSFYTSIYGDNANVLNKYHRKNTYNEASEVILVTRENNQDDEDVTDIKVENKKHLNNNYYLDDPETEVMNLQIKNDNQQNETDYSITPPNSAVIRNLTMNFDTLVKYASYNSSDTDLKPKNASCDSDKHELTSSEKLHNTTSESTTNTNINNNAISSSKKSLIKVECKKSIDKIYELMKRLSKVETSESLYTRRPLSPIHANQRRTSSKSFLLPTTESGTSFKPQLNSSNPSIYSFEETINNEISIPNNNLKKRAGAEANVISKVIISSKSQRKSDNNEMRTNKKVTVNSPENMTKNPLKAISHLINEFDHIQKIRQKAETKDCKRINNKTIDGKSSFYNSSIKKALRLDDQIKDTNANKTKMISPNNKKIQSKVSANRAKITNQQNSNINKGNDREKNINDILEEALKEARGEAVRGPQRPYTRLESLAQPKRVNVNGQAERLRQGRTFSSPQVLEKFLNSVPTNPKLKQKKVEQDQNNTPLPKITYNVTSSDKPAKQKRLANNSTADGTVMAPANVPSYKPRTVSEASPNVKRMTLFETNLKKRPLVLTATAASSNLLEKNPRSFTLPTSKISHLTRVSTVANSSSTPNCEPYENKLRVVINSLQNESGRTLPIIKESKTSVTYNESKNESIPPDDLKNDELVSICSDYVFDILEDKDVLTAVSNILPKNAKGKEDMEEENNKSNTDVSSIDIPQHNEVVDGIESLEKALYNQIAHGTFHKRLKIKNFTLTPKQSMNPIYLLQSGDANSLLINSCKPPNLYINSSKCITEQLHVPIFRGSFAEQAFTRLPVNISTVGYVFSKLQPIEYNPDDGIKSMGIQTSVSLNEVQPDEKFSNEPDEKAVQTVQFDTTTHCHNFARISKEKVNKSTDLNDSFLTFNTTEDNGKAIIKSENVNNTTSLDILVELLDEIEKITKYQSSNAVEKHNTSKQTFDSIIKQEEYNTVKEIGYTVISDKQENINVFNVNKSNLVDKEVTVNIIKESVNGYTDASSQLCLLENTTHLLKTFIGHAADETINTCTDEGSQYYLPNNHEIAPDTLTGIIGRSSTHSLISLYDYRAYYCNNFKEITNNIATHNRSNNAIAKYENFPKKRASRNDHNYEILKTMKSSRQDKNSVSYYVEQKDSDAILKMKRDILVTVYSILVFTVFAALSFPEFLYRS